MLVEIRCQRGSTAEVMEFRFPRGAGRQGFIGSLARKLPPRRPRTTGHEREMLRAPYRLRRCEMLKVPDVGDEIAPLMGVPPTVVLARPAPDPRDPDPPDAVIEIAWIDPRLWHGVEKWSEVESARRDQVVREAGEQAARRRRATERAEARRP